MTQDQYNEAYEAGRAAGHPVDMEPVAIRHSFDGYGWMYIDNGHGSGWRGGIDKADAEFLYTAAQLQQAVAQERERHGKAIDGWVNHNVSQEQKIGALEAALRQAREALRKLRDHPGHGGEYFDVIDAIDEVLKNG